MQINDNCRRLKNLQTTLEWPTFFQYTPTILDKKNAKTSKKSNCCSLQEYLKDNIFDS